MSRFLPRHSSGLRHQGQSPRVHNIAQLLPTEKCPRTGREVGWGARLRLRQVDAGAPAIVVETVDKISGRVCPRLLTLAVDQLSNLVCPTRGPSMGTNRWPMTSARFPVCWRTELSKAQNLLILLS